MCAGKTGSRRAPASRRPRESSRPSSHCCRPVPVRTAAGRPIGPKVPGPAASRKASATSTCRPARHPAELAGNFQAAVRARQRSTITARSPPGESFLSNSSIGPLANSASPPRRPNAARPLRCRSRWYGHRPPAADAAKNRLAADGPRGSAPGRRFRPQATAGPRRCLLPVRARPRSSQRSWPGPSRPTSSGGLAPAPASRPSNIAWLEGCHQGAKKRQRVHRGRLFRQARQPQVDQQRGLLGQPTAIELRAATSAWRRRRPAEGAAVPALAFSSAFGSAACWRLDTTVQTASTPAKPSKPETANTATRPQSDRVNDDRYVSPATTSGNSKGVKPGGTTAAGGQAPRGAASGASGSGRARRQAGAPATAAAASVGKLNRRRFHGRLFANGFAGNRYPRTTDTRIPVLGRGRRLLG